MIKSLARTILKKTNYGLKKLDRNHDTIINEILKKTNPILFDIGANLGQTIDRFESLFSKPKIFSFEPTPSLFNSLNEKYDKRKNIHLSDYAITNEEKTVSFNIHETSSGSSSIENVISDSRFAKRRNLENNITKVNVKGISLDKFCRENKVNHIDLLKIDVQGHEKEVLEGATELIKNQKINIIEIEVIIGEAYVKKVNFYDIEQYLIPNNYRLVALSPDGRFYNLQPHDIFLNEELQFDCIYVAENYLKSLSN